MTQEELAERAGLSARGVSDLERGLNRAPQRETLRRLVDALGLSEADRLAFLQARQRSAAGLTDPETRAPRHNLPRELSSFVGREREVSTVVRRLDEAPLVTLAGAGGIGKTRLAMRVARTLTQGPESAFGDGVWLVELADHGEPDAVSRRIAATLGIGDDPHTPQTDTLARVLQRQRLLLVLDNCEHLIDACATVATRLLRASEGLRILATSREPLGVPGESV